MTGQRSGRSRSRDDQHRQLDRKGRTFRIELLAPVFAPIVGCRATDSRALGPTSPPAISPNKDLEKMGRYKTTSGFSERNPGFRERPCAGQRGWA